MSKIRVYSEYCAIKAVVANKGQYPVLYDLFVNMAEIISNISEELWAKECEEETDVYRFIREHSVKLEPKTNIFESFKDEKEVIAKEPMAIYILDISKNDAINLQETYGVYMLSSKELSDLVYLKEFQVGVYKPEENGSAEYTDWYGLFKNYKDVPPVNSIVFCDNYALSQEREKDNVDENKTKEHKKVIIGLNNLLEVLDIFMPKQIHSSFRIVIFSKIDLRKLEKDLVNIKTYITKRKEAAEQFFNDVKEKRKGLGEEHITISYVFVKKEIYDKIDIIHNRWMYTNTFVLTADRGFDTFFEGNVINSNKISTKFYIETGKFGDSTYKMAKRDLRILGKLLDRQQIGTLSSSKFGYMHYLLDGKTLKPIDIDVTKYQ